MNIFISRHDDLRVHGLAQAIKTIVPTSFFWNRQEKPLFDLLQDSSPDVIFYHDADALDGSIALAKLEYPDVKFVYMQFMPALSGASPDLTIHMIPLTCGENTMYLDYSVNLVDMTGGIKRDKFSTQILAITDNIDNENQFQILALRALSHKFQTKIYGNTRVGIPNYLGRLRQEDYKDVFASAKILVAFDETRCNDAAYHNCVPLVYGKDFRNVTELLEECEKLLKIERTSVGSGHSYHDAAVEVFSKLGYEDLAEKTNEFLKQRKEVV